MRIDPVWLRRPETQAIFEMLKSHPTFVVGGCVRNTLLGEPTKDIDFATAAWPDAVTRIAEASGFKAIPTGFEHGTVTVVAHETPFEITTFRRDVATDGRRAVVAFSQSIEEDARRRDFTINAIYADATGTIHDPVNGLADIEARRIRFIEDAQTRIQEDYLRILRFYRFFAWYGDPQAGMDVHALDAIARNCAGLETLSRERVGSEIYRLLSAPDPSPAVATMRASGVLKTVLPGSDDTALGPLVHLEADLDIEPDALRRLAVLGGAIDTLRLSRAQYNRISALRENASISAGELGYRHGYQFGRDALLIAAAFAGHTVSDDAIAQLNKGSQAKFPLSASDLMPKFARKALGDELRRLEDIWIKSDFTLSREALLSRG